MICDIFLAQRLSTLRSVNRVLLLKNGHVAAAGSHNDLWKDNDQYRRIQMLADATATETNNTVAKRRRPRGIADSLGQAGNRSR